VLHHCEFTALIAKELNVWCMGYFLRSVFSEESQCHCIYSRHLHGSVLNETNVAGNHSVEFRVSTVVQQSFNVTLCVTSSFKKISFDGTIVSNFMKPISCNWFHVCVCVCMWPLASQDNIRSAIDHWENKFKP
jgi:hypothetical protein